MQERERERERKKKSTHTWCRGGGEVRGERKSLCTWEREGEGEGEKEHMLVVVGGVGERKSVRTWERERESAWLLLLYVFSPWACPMQIGLSQECYST